MDIIFDAFRNLCRRKFRTLLAVSGVAVGIFAFLVMGAMAEHFRRISVQFEYLFENRIFICERLSFWAGGGILSEAKLKKVKEIPGIEEAIPMLISRWSDERMVVVGLPRVVVGLPLENIKSIIGRFRVISGNLALNDKESVIVGYDLAQENKLSTGSKVKIGNEDFIVSGILEKTGGLYDGQMFIRLSEAQKAFHRKDLITSIMLIPSPRVDPEKLSVEIKNRVKGIEVIPPSRIKSQIRSSLSLWNGLTFGAAFTACVAGALCVIIIMLVSVSERAVEIGLKRAIGAATSHIMLEFLSEAVMVTVSGWFIGSIAGWFFICILTRWLHSMGSNLFDLTPRLFVTALVGVVALGLLSGLYPALRAASIEPAEALKVRY
ncbi:MAG: ABC transporter permease [Candidatus Eremiobacteraeota bacterium]|nr:ABC transporter permease [Candidatus Eremiobacteraeota bacterium]